MMAFMEKRVRFGDMLRKEERRVGVGGDRG